jgi:hypothetical protein
LDDEQLRECVTEESWTLGATDLKARTGDRRSKRGAWTGPGIGRTEHVDG